MYTRLVRKCAHASNGVIERHVDIDSLCNEILDLDNMSFPTQSIYPWLY